MHVSGAAAIAAVTSSRVEPLWHGLGVARRAQPERVCTATGVAPARRAVGWMLPVT